MMEIQAVDHALTHAEQALAPVEPTGGELADGLVEGRVVVVDPAHVVGGADFRQLAYPTA